MKVIGKKHSKQYTLKEVLGQGSFGKVYNSPPYAIKEINFQGLPPFITNSLKNEINILKKINHQNVVKLMDYFYQGQCVYLVMEYCEQDLSQYLKKNKCDERMAVHIFKQLIMGFRELVNLGIIHRDLKPANILVNSKGEFKLADFGFAKYVDNYDTKLLYSIVGSPLYMAPQILNKSKYTTKSDIWSLGFVFYQMLTGTYPWMGMNQNDLYRNITTRPLNVPKNISAFSKQLITRMLKINQKQRISWEELFQTVLVNHNNKSPEKMRVVGRQPRTERQQSKENKQNARTPSRRKLFPQTPEKKPQSAVKLAPLANNQAQPVQPVVPSVPQRVSLSQNIIRELFMIELERYCGQDSSTILDKGIQRMSHVQKERVQRAIQNFNEQFQKAVRTIYRL